jgi:predicted amidohydrolase YtcJ
MFPATNRNNESYMLSYRIFKNADVVTMDPDQPKADAFLVCGDRFAAVGSLANIKRCAPHDVEDVDLNGKTVLPGFVETHNHLCYYAMSLINVDCSSEANRSIMDIQEKIREKEQSLEPGAWLEGSNYDDTLIEECRHLNRSDLDEALPNNPIVIWHATGHLGYANSIALEMAGITRDTPQPEGGTIDKDEKGEPTGLLMEPAAQNMVARCLPKPDVSVFKNLIPQAVEHYNREGVTSVHDGAIGMIGETGRIIYQAYRELEAEDQLSLRVYLTTMHDAYEDLIKMGIGRGFGSDLLRIGAVKIFQDGSIQCLTAALAQGYHCQPDFLGEFIRPQEKLDSLVERFQKEGLQIAIHANGDAAIESVICAFERAQEKYPQSDLRHMIIHCQTASNDHIARMNELGIVPSYFPNHVYYWGDRHVSMFLGPVRAARINPLGSSVKTGLRFTLHADTPVTPISPLHSIHCAVNRITREGHVLGPDERISPYDALKGYTVDAAYCSFEEDLKGSINAGKLADFIVLADNPLTIDPLGIKDIKVLKTYLGGNVIHDVEGSV